MKRVTKGDWLRDETGKKYEVVALGIPTEKHITLREENTRAENTKEELTIHISVLKYYKKVTAGSAVKGGRVDKWQ